MNMVLFGVKRAFQSTLRLTRRWMARLRLTPARYDMLRAIARGRSGMLQVELRSILGVTPQTISRMLRALEDLKLVTRSRDAYCDGRRLWVRLTDLGRTRLRRAEKVFRYSGALRVALDCALAEPEVVVRGGVCWTAWDEACSVFERMRHAFNDRATLYDRWRECE